MTNEKILEVKKALQQTEIKILAHKRALNKVDFEINELDEQIQDYIVCGFEDRSFIEELEEEKKIHVRIMQKLAEKVLDYEEVKRKLEKALNDDESQN